MTIAGQLATDCDAYLAGRRATYDMRVPRFSAAFVKMAEHSLTDTDIVLDFGAGSTDFHRFLIEQEWTGRYWPVDGWMGTDLQWWKPKRRVDWLIGLEVIEHLHMGVALQLLEDFKEWVTKGIVLTTPNPDTVDVLGIDETHKWACHAADLQRHEYLTEHRSHFGKDDDSILAWWYA